MKPLIELERDLAWLLIQAYGRCARALVLVRTSEVQETRCNPINEPQLPKSAMSERRSSHKLPKGEISPAKLEKRMRDHHFAVLHYARYRARKEVERELREQGRRVTLIAPREINELAREHLAQHSERLRAEAEQAIATSPRFKQWRWPY
jgi:hypothetical protein